MAIRTNIFDDAARARALETSVTISTEAEVFPPIDYLWTVKEAAAFLARSERWTWYMLKAHENEPGSIPHVMLGRSPRFIPADMKAWAAAGFPPAASFKTWKADDERRRKR